ncbi:unnamed protein product [Adineta steineri]|uniref:Cytochrome b5 domain-containing protein 1 n=1 Tax=Adineta steineri TaxID=433720 RepID=A0A813N648_9BILA|nr:unnamed protein product [Adineta steineri]CAF3725746.1 unnamed protein product [Adineta steineri]
MEEQLLSIGTASEILNNFQEDQKFNKGMQDKTFDDYDKKARFLLPEIDSSNQQRKKYQIKKRIIILINNVSILKILVNNSSQPTPKKQFIFNQMINTTEDEEKEQKSSSSILNKSTLDIPKYCRPNVNNTLQEQAESLLPFYTFNELTRHNDSNDAWICIFGHIYNITSLIRKAQGTKLYQQLISYVGQDISFLFDERTHEPRRRIHPQTFESVSVIENLSILESFGIPFWQTKDLFIGRLTEYPRYIRLIHNFSPNHPFILEIAEEETIGQIAIKFLKYNSHIFSYIWRYNQQILDFNKTLTENGIPNEELFHDKHGWRSDNENCLTIILCFSDDLTIA